MGIRVQLYIEHSRVVAVRVECSGSHGGHVGLSCIGVHDNRPQVETEETLSQERSNLRDYKLRIAQKLQSCM